jgi:hypothetical protein
MDSKKTKNYPIELQVFFVVVAIIGVLIVLFGNNALKMRKMIMYPSTANVNVKISPDKTKTCPYEDENICNFMKTWNFIQEERVFTVTEHGEAQYDVNAPTVTHTLITKVNGPNSEFISSTNNIEETHIVDIGREKYIKNISQGSWTKMSAEENRAGNEARKLGRNLSFTDDDANLKTNINFLFIGKEKCNELTCFKYKIKTHDRIEVSDYIWFDDTYFYLRKTQTTSENSTNERTFDYKLVEITSPIK